MFNLIIQCGAKKHTSPKRVEDMYLGTFWNVYRKNKPTKKHNVYVLSAKYGIVSGNKIINPYNKKFTEQNYKQMLPMIRAQIKQYNLKKCYFVGSSLYKKVLYESGLNTIHITKGNNGIGYSAQALKEFLGEYNAK